MLVHDFLTRSARERPDKVALVCDEHRLTYRELDELTDQLANTLRDRGVCRGDRVAIYLPNCTATVLAVFATLKAGGVFVIINHTTKAEKLAYILEDCQATCFFTDPVRMATAARNQGRVASLRFGIVANYDPQSGSGLPDGCYELTEAMQGAATQSPSTKLIDRDLACLIYTSGSTGDPKGVMSDHSNMVFAAESIIRYLQNTEQDIVIDVLPLSFDYGLYQLLMVFAFGGTLVLEGGFTFPAHLLRRIEQERVTGLPGVPTIFSVLLQMDLAAFDLSSLRYVTNTAASLPVSHIQAIRRKLPGVTVYSMYGLTETKRTLYLPPEQLDIRPDSVGIAIPGTEVWLEDESGRRVDLGGSGELVVRGRHVMRGYWNNPEATARRFRPGPLPGETVCHTGDIFRTDEDGYFYFVGRMDDIIKCRGEKVAPKEIENVLYALPGVVETAVVGVADAVMGQAIKVFVVTDGNGLTASDVLAHCRRHLEEYMMPKYVEFRSELPKTTSGKIQKLGLT
jgi:amino acid adenylation domain-containing protein